MDQPFWRASEFWITIMGLVMVTILGLYEQIQLEGNQIINLIIVLVGARTVSKVGGQIATSYSTKNKKEEINSVTNEEKNGTSK